MSSNGTIPSAVVGPIIQAYASAIRPSIVYIMIGTVFSSMLIPLIIALWYFSTPESRKRPLFILNISALFLGLASGILNAHLQITTILSPLKGSSSSEDFASIVIMLWMPWISEAVLIIRLLAVFPTTDRKKRALLLVFPVIIKCLRASMFIVYLRRWKVHLSGQYNPAVAAQLGTSWVAKVSFIAELADNGYVSGIFLWQLYHRGHIANRATLGNTSQGSTASFGHRVRALFLITATTFVVPVALDICNIVIIFATGNITLTNYISTANLYVVIISTVSATLWSSSYTYRKNKQSQPSFTALEFNGSSAAETIRPRFLDIERAGSVEKTDSSGPGLAF